MKLRQFIRWEPDSFLVLRLLPFPVYITTTIHSVNERELSLFFSVYFFGVRVARIIKP